jgi:hypothetical protein
MRIASGARVTLRGSKRDHMKLVTPVENALF